MSDIEVLCFKWASKNQLKDLSLKHNQLPMIYYWNSTHNKVIFVIYIKHCDLLL